MKRRSAMQRCSAMVQDYIGLPRLGDLDKWLPHSVLSVQLTGVDPTPPGQFVPKTVQSFTHIHPMGPRMMVIKISPLPIDLANVGYVTPKTFKFSWLSLAHCASWRWCRSLHRSVSAASRWNRALQEDRCGSNVDPGPCGPWKTHSGHP
jgi:hypothetical protein